MSKEYQCFVETPPPKLGLKFTLLESDTGEVMDFEPAETIVKLTGNTITFDTEGRKRFIRLDVEIPTEKERLTAKSERGKFRD